MTERGGYTGTRDYEPAGIVHYGSGFTKCTCGSTVSWENGPLGTSYRHLGSFARWNQHIFMTPSGKVLYE